MKTRSGAATDVGLVRDHNEDGYLVSAPLFVVADGMGGHLGGEVASATALETLATDPGDPGQRELTASMKRANAAIFERQIRDASVAGMGTTMTALVVDRNTVRIAHVGDSRAYLLRDGELKMLTEDHTLVGEMVRDGSITDEQARIHPRRSILTRALGTEPDVEVDEYEVEIRMGDRMMLCTDGLSGMIDDAAIRAVLTRETDAQDACDRLIEAANRAGGTDNITVVVIDCIDGDVEPPSTEPSTEEVPGLLSRLLHKK